MKFVVKYVVSEALLKFSYITNTFVSNKMLIVFAKKKKRCLLFIFPCSLQVSFLFFFLFHQSNRVNKRKIKLNDREGLACCYYIPMKLILQLQWLEYQRRKQWQNKHFPTQSLCHQQHQSPSPSYYWQEPLSHFLW